MKQVALVGHSGGHGKGIIEDLRPVVLFESPPGAPADQHGGMRGHERLELAVPSLAPEINVSSGALGVKRKVQRHGEARAQTGLDTSLKLLFPISYRASSSSNRVFFSQE